MTQDTTALETQVATRSGTTPAAPTRAGNRRKRSFDATPAPAPSVSAANGSRYAIQRNGAGRLHDDLRLEHGGVLWSWEVPRGMPAQAGERRLAWRTEDPPVDCIDFAGDLPHGGDDVESWDRGTWRCVDPVEPTLADERLVFELRGGRAAGRYALVRARGRDGRSRLAERRWFVVRLVDKAAPTPRARTSRASAGVLAPWSPGADFAYELARSSDRVPTEGPWAFAIKFDGYRALAVRRGGTIRLVSRGRHPVNAPAIAAGLAQIPGGDFVLDGELVVATAAGRHDVGAVGSALSNGGEGLVFVAFDLLHSGRDLRAYPFDERRAALEALLRPPRSAAIALARDARGACRA